jgi:hypothetical protein
LNLALFWCFEKIFFVVESWNIKLNFSTFSVGGCWGQTVLLFWKLVDETQMGNPWLLRPCSQRYVIKILNPSTPQSHLL